MTTAQIATYADSKGLASSDLDLQVLLRRKLVPDFLARVGYTAWRRKEDTAAVSANVRYFDITDNDFWHMKKLVISGEEETQLLYIGDDETKVLQAAATTTADADKPTGYYLRLVAGSPAVWRVYFDVPTDTARTFAYIYDTNIYFADDSTSVNFDAYIPHQFQWALVEMLKAEIFADRFGAGDESRYSRATQEAERIIQLAQESPDLSRGGKARYIS